MLSLLTEQLRTLVEGWKKVPGGYAGVFGGERAVVKKGKNNKWFLHFKGKIYPMPKRPSFDHAEGLIQQVLG